MRARCPGCLNSKSGTRVEAITWTRDSATVATAIAAAATTAVQVDHVACSRVDDTLHEDGEHAAQQPDGYREPARPEQACRA